jgi:hypothetical protein
MWCFGGALTYIVSVASYYPAQLSSPFESVVFSLFMLGTCTLSSLEGYTLGIEGAGMQVYAIFLDSGYMNLLG